VQTSSELSLPNDYGVLTRRRLALWIGALVLLSTSAATLLGFVGARHGISFRHFDWSLAAVAGTAIGTVVLAGFTGALAWTTSGDVRATIRLADATVEDQRARDRPIVVVRIVEVEHVTLDPAGRVTVPALHVWVKNVGLGPAIDLRLWPTYKGTPTPEPEVIAVYEVGAESTRPLSLAGVEEPVGGFQLDDFNVVGEANDRTGRGAHAVSLVAEAGMPDQMRVASEAAAKKAWPVLIPGVHGPPRGAEVRYDSAVLNRGPREAEDVRLQLVDENYEDWGEPIIVGNIPPNHQEQVEVVCPYPHPTWSCRLTWRDGRGRYQSSTLRDAYLAVPAGQS
jgi:hypothetical protein